MSVVDQILEAGGEHPPGSTEAPPLRQLAILTCMDARIDPLALGGLDLGDAHVIRNAGGLATDDAIRSLAISQLKLGTREVLVVGHTGCGLDGADEQELGAELEQLAGKPAPFSCGAFSDLEESVAAAVRRVRESPFLAHTDAVRGAIVDVVSGKLRPVVG